MKAGCVPAADGETAAGCDTTIKYGSVAAACGVTAAACGVVAGCVTMTGCTRVECCMLAGDSRGTDNVTAVTCEVALDEAGEVATATLEMPPETSGDVVVSVGRRALLTTVPSRIPYSSSAIVVEFEVLSLFRLIIYFANSKLNFKAFDYFVDFCGCKTTGN